MIISKKIDTIFHQVVDKLTKNNLICHFLPYSCIKTCIDFFNRFVSQKYTKVSFSQHQSWFVLTTAKSLDNVDYFQRKNVIFAEIRLGFLNAFDYWRDILSSKRKLSENEIIYDNSQGEWVTFYRIHITFKSLQRHKKRTSNSIGFDYECSWVWDFSCKSKISDLPLPIFPEDVGRFDIPMNDISLS